MPGVNGSAGESDELAESLSPDNLRVGLVSIDGGIRTSNVRALVGIVRGVGVRGQIFELTGSFATHLDLIRPEVPPHELHDLTVFLLWQY